MEIVCAICLENYEPNHSVISVQCGHIFHEQCLTDWTKKSPTCPICEVNCQPSVHKKLFLNFDSKDCTQCQQYTLLIEIKENQVDKLKTDHTTAIEKITALQNAVQIKELKVREFEAKTMEDEAIIKKNNNELSKLERTVALLKEELSKFRINNDNKKEEPDNNLTENINIINT